VKGRWGAPTGPDLEMFLWGSWNELIVRVLKNAPWNQKEEETERDEKQNKQHREIQLPVTGNSVLFCGSPQFIDHFWT